MPDEKKLVQDKRRWRRAYVRLWDDPDFQRLSDGEKVMAQYVLFGPQSNRIGLFKMSPGLGVEHLGCSLKVFRVRLETVCRVFKWEFDPAVHVIWIPSWWDYNPPTKNEDNMSGALTDIATVPPTPLMSKFTHHLRYVPEGLHKYFAFVIERYGKEPVGEPVGDQCPTGALTQEAGRRTQDAGRSTQEIAARRGEVFLDEWFEQFKDAYPASRRVGGDLARRAFVGALNDRPDQPAHFVAMLAALEQHKRSEQWHTPKLIPLMTTWLHQERWQQVLPEVRAINPAGQSTRDAAERVSAALRGKA